MIQRCDGVYNCVDKSDETACKIISLDTFSYRKEQPPSVSNKLKDEVKVTISFEIFKISKFREVEHSFNIKFLMKVKWFDNRLTFQNLKSNIFKNVIGVAQKHLVWIPPLIFNNSEDTTTLSMNSKGTDEQLVNLLVQRGPKNKYDVAKSSFLDETYFYKGEENYMVLTTEYNMMLHCNYKLESYPFDTQKCSMEVSDNAHLNYISNIYIYIF